MTTPNNMPNMPRQTFAVAPDAVYAAMLQMIDFSASFDMVQHDDSAHTITFSTPGTAGLFTAKVFNGADGASSVVELTVPLDAGNTGQQTIGQFYKELADQISAQTAQMGAPTTVLASQTETPTQTMPLGNVPTQNDANSQGTHAAKPNKFKAFITDANTGKLSKMAVTALVLSCIYLLYGFIALASHAPIAVSIVFGVIVAVFDVLAFLKTQPGKKHGRMQTCIATVITVIALVLSIIGGAGESGQSSYCEKGFSWPTSGAAADIPSMKKNRGYISSDSSDGVRIYACGVSLEEFNAYTEQLKKKGFNQDYDKWSTGFSANNTAGGRVHVSYNKSDKRMSVDYDTAEYVQRLNSEKEESESSSPSATETNDADKQAEEQKKAEEEKKKAEEEQKKQEEEQKKVQEEEAQKEAESQNQNSSSGVSKEVKDAMDSYESYMNKYCDFMKKYQDDGSPASMLNDYLKMMNEYTEMTKKINDMDQASWTEADMQYYLEVMNSVNTKLAQI